MKNTVAAIKKTLSLMGIIIIPCFVQVHFWQNHSIIHDFSTLKFSIVLATIPFVLIPILIYLFLKTNLNDLHLKLGITYKKETKSVMLPLFVFLIFILAGLYLADAHADYEKMFPEPNPNFERIGNFISQNTNYSDVVFSPNFEIGQLPPQQLSYSMKRIYKANSTDEIYAKVKDIDKEFNINIFLDGETNYTINDSKIKKLLLKAYDIKQGKNLSLYKISKKDFLNVYYLDESS